MLEPFRIACSRRSKLPSRLAAPNARGVRGSGDTLPSASLFFIPPVWLTSFAWMVGLVAARGEETGKPAVCWRKISWARFSS